MLSFNFSLNLKYTSYVSRVNLNFEKQCFLRWLNTAFGRALTNAIKHAQKDCKKKQTCRRYIDHFICSTPALFVQLFFIIERSVLMALAFYHKGIIEKVTMQRTQQFSAF